MKQWIEYYIYEKKKKTKLTTRKTNKTWAFPAFHFKPTKIIEVFGLLVQAIQLFNFLTKLKCLHIIDSFYLIIKLDKNERRLKPNLGTLYCHEQVFPSNI